MKSITFILAILVGLTFVGFIYDMNRLNKDIEKVRVELNKPDTVFIKKINDTTFQKRNITYIIR